MVTCTFSNFGFLYLADLGEARRRGTPGESGETRAHTYARSHTRARMLNPDRGTGSEADRGCEGGRRPFAPGDSDSLPPKQAGPPLAGEPSRRPHHWALTAAQQPRPAARPPRAGRAPALPTSARV